MKYRRFGRTELNMPVLTCGGMRYQHKWNDEPMADIPADNQANLEKTIHRAIELGINHIETARGYGTSEMQLGQVLPKLPREKIIVQTKVAPSENADDFLKTFDKSMEYLKLDHVELLSLHGVNNAETLDWSLRKNGCLAAARKIQAEGRAKFIGFSTHAPEGIITQAIETGEFDYVNLHWYFVNHFNWPSVLAAGRHDMGVFIISPNDKGGLLYQPSPKLSNLCQPLSPMIFNDLYCLARPEIHTLSIGASKPSDFDEHIKALEYYDRAAEVIAPIEKRLREEMVSALGADWCRNWWQGIPEHTELPGDINLLEILRLWSLAKSLDMVDFGRMRYNLLGNAGHWFPGKNAAEFDAKEIRKHLDGNPFIDRIPQILSEAHDMLHGEQKKRLSESD
ncbi:MAG: aldo/keto reductase [Chthoniobacteraceae bacterium]